MNLTMCDVHSDQDQFKRDISMGYVQLTEPPWCESVSFTCSTRETRITEEVFPDVCRCPRPAVCVCVCVCVCVYSVEQGEIKRALMLVPVTDAQHHRHPPPARHVTACSPLWRGPDGAPRGPHGPAGGPISRESMSGRCERRRLFPGSRLLGSEGDWRRRTAWFTAREPNTRTAVRHTDGWRGTWNRKGFFRAMPSKNQFWFHEEPFKPGFSKEPFP